MSAAMFHLSIPVQEIDSTLAFYRDVLGCRPTRVASDRIDFEFFGHHLVAQLAPDEAAHRSVKIGTPAFPLRHFGVIVSPAAFDAMVERWRTGRAEIAYGPERIFAGTPRDQRVAIFADPSGNSIEIKGIAEPANVFA